MRRVLPFSGSGCRLALVLGIAAVGALVLSATGSPKPAKPRPIGQQIEFADNVFAVAFGPGGKRAYVAHFPDQQNIPGQVSVVDVRTRRILDSVVVGREPSDIVLSRDGTFAFVLNEGDNTVSVLDTTDERVVDTIEVGVAPVDGVDVVTQRGEFLFVANAGPLQPPRGSVDVISVPSFDRVARFDFACNPVALAARPFGKTVYAGCANSGTVQLINTRALTLGASLTVSGLPSVTGLALSPNALLLYVAGGFPGSAVVSTRTGATLAFFAPDPPGDPIQVAVAPNGIALIVNGETDPPTPGSLTVVDRTQKVTVFGALAVLPASIAIAPDGRETWIGNVGLDHGSVTILTTPTRGGANSSAVRF